MAALALCSAILTGTGVVWLGGPEAYARLAAAWILIAAVGLFWPTAMTVVVVGGQMLTGMLLLGPTPVRLLPLVLAMAGVVATAELLGLVDRLNTPLERGARSELNRAGASAVVGGVVFAAVVAVGKLPGPTGLVAVALASGACVVLAILLLGQGPASVPRRASRSGKRSRTDSGSMSSS
jgi:hypothetical protein